jgi:hypothetical protein
VIELKKSLTRNIIEAARMKQMFAKIENEQEILQLM